MKRTVALLLAVLLILSAVGCAQRTNVKTNGMDTNADGTKKEIASKDKYNFLVMGYDRIAMLADVIMLVSFDTEDKNMTIMQLPRDTYVEVEDNSYHKLNGIFNHFVSKAKKEDSKTPETDGCNMTAEYLEKALGIPIHYSAVMDLDGFGNIVDAVGGVNFYVPYPVHYEDPAQNLYIHLEQKRYNLTGDQAEQFVRFRSGYANADLGRGDAQKMFMTAFMESVKANIGLSNVANVAGAVINNVNTSMKVGDIVSFGKAFLSVELENTLMFTAPGELASSYYVLNKESMKNVLSEYFNIFEEDLTDEEVDNDGIFCDEDNEAVLESYEKPADELKFDIHNASDVSKDDIYVPVK
ncbi:MAG: LCP family protein [Clostridia bacterium]|nr:LCP family protein [Clostridia bacterium]